MKIDGICPISISDMADVTRVRELIRSQMVGINLDFWTQLYMAKKSLVIDFDSYSSRCFNRVKFIDYCEAFGYNPLDFFKNPIYIYAHHMVFPEIDSYFERKIKANKYGFHKLADFQNGEVEQIIDFLIDHLETQYPNIGDEFIKVLPWWN